MTPFFMQLQTLVVGPTLGMLELDSPSAQMLVLATAAQESGGQYLRQWPSGPALGFWQIEPATLDDVHKSFLAYRPALAAKVRALLVPEADRSMQLATNLCYGAAVCRLIYARVTEPLPAPNDIAGMARYWKIHYNTADGAGTEELFAINWRRYLG